LVGIKGGLVICFPEKICKVFVVYLPPNDAAANKKSEHDAQQHIDYFVDFYTHGVILA